MTPGRLVSLFAFGLLCVVGGHAQSSATGSSSYIFGRVVDPSDTGATSVSVSVVNEDNGFRHATMSDDSGAYAVGPLTRGSYKVTVRKEGFRTMIRFHVRLDGTTPARADFALSLGSVQETMTVEDSPEQNRLDEVAVHTQLSRA